MFRKTLVLIMAMLTLPNIASAFNYWSVTATTSPTTITGAIAPQGSGFSQSGTVTNITSATATSIDFNVTAAPVGFTLSAVTIDGVAKGNAGGTYTVTKGSKISHAISATYATRKYSITTSKTGIGIIDATVQVPYNTTRVINITAGPGQQIASVTKADDSALDASVTFTGDQFSRAYTFAAVQADQTLKVNFAAVPVVTAKIATSPQSIGLDTPLTIDGSTSTSSVTPTFTWSVDKAGASVTGIAGGKASLNATAPGTYTITLRLSAAGTSDSSASVLISAVSGAMYASSACVTCHNGRSAAVVTAYTASKHAATATASCQGCHAGEHAAAVQPSACASCHDSAAVHGVASLACSTCHNSHSLGVSVAALDHAAVNPSPAFCGSCHETVADSFSTSLHGTRQGKSSWYNDNLGNPTASELQKGFGNYVQTAYADLPCGKCHNPAAWTVGGVDKWAASTGGGMVCTDCHGNKAAGINTTSVAAPVAKSTCFGCHSRQANEASAGLTDVHFLAGMGCPSCHSSSDMHGNGTQHASQLAFGAISAQCENCHGKDKTRGPISSIAAHQQHAGNIACSTCHAESMITCHNCHFDNEAGAGGALKAKFFSGKMGGTVASGNSWRFLVNRVMPDGSTKIYPGSMQSLVADYAADGANDGQGRTHAGIAPYYSHAITRVNALSCDKCHGTETAVRLAAGQSVRVTTWKAEAGVAVSAANVATTFVGPKGVIPVPENPRGKLLMDFVDLTNPELGTASNRVLFQKDGPDTIHMPQAYVKPLTALQMQKLASVQLDHSSAVVTASASPAGYTANTCNGCHATVNSSFATSLHGTRQGKETFYNHNLGNAAADPLQKGFGNYVNVAYAALPCVDCHNPAAWTASGGSDTWPLATSSTPVCTDCHSNKVNGVAGTAFDAPVAKATCIGCHSRQANETSMGLTDVHMNGAVINGQTMNFACSRCHSLTDMHGDGTQKASQLDPGAVTANCDNCHSAMAASTTPEHTVHLANIACSTCHMESVITCYGCHFDNEASDPADSTILHAKFASGKFGGTGANSWRFLVNRVMPDGSTKIYPASMQSLVADRTAANAPGEDNVGWTHAAIAPYYSHSITRVNALKCDKCHGIQKAIDLRDGVPVRVVKWAPNSTTYPTGEVPVSAMAASYTVKPSGVIPVPENPVGKLLMDFVDLVNPAAGPLNASGTSPSARKLFKADGPDTIHMPAQYVRPLTAAQINALATPQVRP